MAQAASFSTPPFLASPDIWQMGTPVTLPDKPGFLSDWKPQPHPAQQDTRKAKALQEEVDRALDQLRQQQEARYQHLLQVFQQRFEDDKTVFAAFSAEEVFTIFRLMARQMLLYFPTRISADVTGDASIILQAHYGNLHFYWEAFLIPEEPTLHSTLNAFHEKKLIFTSGDAFTTVQEQFIKLMSPLFKQLITIMIEQP